MELVRERTRVGVERHRKRGSILRDERERKREAEPG